MTPGTISNYILYLTFDSFLWQINRNYLKQMFCWYPYELLLLRSGHHDKADKVHQQNNKLFEYSLTQLKHKLIGLITWFGDILCRIALSLKKLHLMRAALSKGQAEINRLSQQLHARGHRCCSHLCGHLVLTVAKLWQKPRSIVLNVGKIRKE